MQNCEMVDQECLFAQDYSYGKTSQEHSQVGSRKERTSVSFWKRSSGLAAAPYQFLDLTPGHGNLLGESYWETRSPYVGESLTLSTGVSPKDVIVSSLSQILEDSPLSKYYLSKTACLGILRRAKERGKELPPQLETALMMQAEQCPPNDGSIAPIAFAANQRDEVRDLHDIAGALGAQPGMKQQTFVAASFSAGAGSSAGGIGYTEEGSPTLKSTEGGNIVPAVLCLNNQDRRHIDWTEDIASTLLSQAGGSPTVLSSEEMIMLCLNDQGGRRMDAHENVSGTLRSQEHGHQPLVMATQQGGAEIGINLCPTITSAAGTSGNNQPILFENHGIDSRYTGPHLYDKVYEGDIDCAGLEDLFRIFNTDHPADYTGRSMSVSDVVEITDSPKLVGIIETEFRYERYTDFVAYISVQETLREQNTEFVAHDYLGLNVPSVEPGFYFCDSIGFKMVNFKPECAGPHEAETMQMSGY